MQADLYLRPTSWSLLTTNILIFTWPAKYIYGTSTNWVFSTSTKDYSKNLFLFKNYYFEGSSEMRNHDIVLSNFLNVTKEWNLFTIFELNQELNQYLPAFHSAIATMLQKEYLGQRRRYFTTHTMQYSVYGQSHFLRLLILQNFKVMGSFSAESVIEFLDL